MLFLIKKRVPALAFYVDWSRNLITGSCVKIVYTSSCSIPSYTLHWKSYGTKSSLCVDNQEDSNECSYIQSALFSLPVPLYDWHKVRPKGNVYFCDHSTARDIFLCYVRFWVMCLLYAVYVYTPMFIVCMYILVPQIFALLTTWNSSYNLWLCLLMCSCRYICAYMNVLVHVQIYI